MFALSEGSVCVLYQVINKNEIQFGVKRMLKSKMNSVKCIGSLDAVITIHTEAHHCSIFLV